MSHYASESTKRRANVYSSQTTAAVVNHDYVLGKGYEAKDKSDAHVL